MKTAHFLLRQLQRNLSEGEIVRELPTDKANYKLKLRGKEYKVHVLHNNGTQTIETRGGKEERKITIYK